MTLYTIRLTVTIPISARSKSQAEERAERLVELAMPLWTEQRWVDAAGTEYQHEVEKEE